MTPSNSSARFILSYILTRVKEVDRPPYYSDVTISEEVIVYIPRAGDITANQANGTAINERVAN